MKTKNRPDLRRCLAGALLFCLLAVPAVFYGQTIIGGNSADPAAVLDLQGNGQGLLLPRLTTAQRDAIVSPPTALIIFNITVNCLQVNVGTPAVPDWQCVASSLPPPPPSVNPTNGASISGVALPGAAVQIDVDNDGIPDYAVLADNGGNYTVPVSPALPHGTQVAVTQVVDGQISVPATVTVFALPPPVPTVNPTNGTVVAGTAVPNITLLIDVNNDGAPDYTTTANGSGNYSQPMSPALPNGALVSVRARDALGNTSAPATVVVDAQAPEPPTVNPTNGAVIAGMAEPNSTVLIDTNNDGTPDYTTTADAGGNYSQPMSPVLPHGTLVAVRARDALGNTSAPATVTVDTQAPAPPTVNPTNGTVIAGTAEPNSTVLIDTNNDGTPDYTTTADANGNYSQPMSPVLPHGTLVAVRARDAAGNTSAPATVVVDAQAPAPPTVNPTNGTVIAGTAEPNSTVLIDTNNDGTPDYITTADGSGNYSQPANPALAHGTLVAVRARDAAGNISAPATVIVDAQAPAPPTVNPTNGTVIAGTAEPNSTVLIDTNNDGTPDYITTTDGSGNYSQPMNPVLPHATLVAVRARDAAGNTSGPATVTVVGPGSIAALDCAGATNNGSLTAGTAASGVSSGIPYTGGDGGTYTVQNVSSTGVTGLTATLAAGTFASGSGTLLYTITGTPSAAGTASFALSIGGRSCTLTRTVTGKPSTNGSAEVSAYACNTGTAGTLVAGVPVSGVTQTITATVVQTGSYSISATANGVTFSATGNFTATGNQNVVLTATGTPTATGSHTFTLITTPNCSFSRSVSAGAISSIACASATHNGILAAGGATDGVSSVVPYTGGNGGAHNGQTVASTGVTGLFAILEAGNFAVGSGSLTYTISGVPASTGTASFALNIGGSTCTLTRTVVAGSIASLDCAGAANSGTLIWGIAASGASAAVPYTGGNGGSHSGQTVASTGVTGLTATLPAGIFPAGSGTLTYTITGTPTATGTASFALNIGGRTCTLSRTVEASAVSTLNCAGAVHNGTLIWGRAASGVSSVVPYTGSNGGNYNGQTVTSTGVTGLTATLSAGSLPSGNGNLTYAITGTPVSSGVASFTLVFGGQTCVLTRQVDPGTIGALNCAGATHNGTLSAGGAASGVSSAVPYTGGNGGNYSAQTVTSTGVTGLTATLSAGTFTTSTGSLTYTITGTPNTTGTASFALNIGGQTCTLTRTVTAGAISSLTCTSATNSGTLIWGLPASSVSSSIPYTGGNGGSHSGQTVVSTGVTGLTATLAPGNFAAGSGSLVYSITGTPASSGTASFALNIGGLTCTLSLSVAAGTISSLTCTSATHSGALVGGILAGSVSSSVPYTGGNGGSHSGQSVTSTGVTGLTATLAAGNFAVGSGSLVYTITGTPSSSGTASFALNIGGRTCTLTRTVAAGEIGSLDCAGAVANGLLVGGSAASGVSSLVPYTGGNGGSHSGQSVTSTGVTGLTATLAAGNFAVGSGSLVYTITGTPNTTGTASFALNIGGRTCTLTRTVLAGTISSLNCFSATNSGSLIWGRSASGVSSSVPYSGGNGGSYSAQSVTSTGVSGLTATLSAGVFANGSGSLAFTITGTPSSSGTANFFLNIGGQSCTLSRFVDAGAIGDLNCAGASNFGVLAAGGAASGVSSSIPYTGGNGGSYNGQSVNSSGVTGLTATLNAGTFANGSGFLSYTITGTPNTTGTASFFLNIGGRSCTLTRTVVAGAVSSLNCGSASQSGTLVGGVWASGVTVFVPYSGGNGGTFAGQSVGSTGVTGLTATLSAGNFANGSGNLTLSISGTPSGSGTANFFLNIGGQSCTLSRPVSAGAISDLFCGSATNNGTLTWNVWTSGASFVVPYSGGNGGTHSGQTVNSTGVTGLTATLSPGSFAFGSGNLTYTISGTPNSAGTASFFLNIGGRSCTLNRTVSEGYAVPNCASTSHSGTLTGGVAASGVSFSVPYSSGNGGGYFGQSVASSGVTGLTATLTAGAYANGSGSLTYTISGTPNGSGTASFFLTIAGQSCTVSRAVSAGSIGSLNCGGVVHNGILADGANASGVSSVVPYTGGNGGSHSGQTVSSTGVTGLTATLSGGTFAFGNGNLTYTISGTPNGSGTASFFLNIGGQSCTISRTVSAGSITSLNCGGATNNGVLTSGQGASGVSSSIPYSGGNGGRFGALSVSSTDVTGLTATLSAGNFAVGNGNLTFTITGTPSRSGTAWFWISIGGQGCWLGRSVNMPPAGVSSLNCGGASMSGSLAESVPVSGVSVSLPYSGGNGGGYGGFSVNSTGVTGLTATLNGGTLATGNGSLSFSISGTPNGSGTATFFISFGGQSCNLNLNVVRACGAFVGSGVWRRFMCHNLGANTGADPFSPSWELNGNYYQWGRNPSCFGRDGVDASNPCGSPVFGAAAPWGNNFSNDNAGSIPNWNSNRDLSNPNDWTDGWKTGNDPCPPGFRVPTYNQLANLFSSNSRYWVGTWGLNSTNYSVGYMFGNSLYLPAAGYRDLHNGHLNFRGSSGYYWASTSTPSSGSWHTNFDQSNAAMYTSTNTYGYSVRCIAE